MEDQLSNFGLSAEVCSGVKYQEFLASVRRNVLIVEDDPMVIEVTQNIFKAMGLDALSAQGGEEALRLFKEYSPRLYCVLLDYFLPGMDSARFLSRAREINPAIRVILMSGYPRSYLEGLFPLTEVQAVIEKPFSPQCLAETVIKI